MMDSEDDWENALDEIEKEEAKQKEVKPVKQSVVKQSVKVIKSGKITATKNKTVLSQEEEKARVQQEIEDSENQLAGELFGADAVVVVKKTLVKSAAAATMDKPEPVLLMDNSQLTDNEEAILFASDVANYMKEKTLRRDNVFISFMKELQVQVTEHFKIDDVNDLKNHLTAQYNAKQAAKNSKKAVKPALNNKKESKGMNNLDAYGNEEAFGRGATGGHKYEDDGLDFM